MKKNLTLKIGISMRIVEELNYSEVRDAIAHDWISFLTKNFPHIIPIFLPNHASLALRTFKTLELDGLILTGGNDISTFPQRDNSELTLLEYCKKNSIPVLGICRGMQLICINFQQTIVSVSNELHVATKHSVSAINKSRFLIPHPINVNSYHNKGLLKLVSNELIAISRSSDGVFEAIEHKYLPIIGIMWHPEREAEITKSDLQLFHNLFLKEPLY